MDVVLCLDQDRPTSQWGGKIPDTPPGIAGKGIAHGDHVKGEAREKKKHLQPADDFPWQDESKLLRCIRKGPIHVECDLVTDICAAGLRARLPIPGNQERATDVELSTASRIASALPISGITSHLQYIHT